MLESVHSVLYTVYWYDVLRTQYYACGTMYYVRGVSILSWRRPRLDRRSLGRLSDFPGFRVRLFFGENPVGHRKKKRRKIRLVADFFPKNPVF